LKHHKRYSLTALLLVSLFVNAVIARQPAAGPDPVEQAAARIVGSILVSGHSMDYLKGLTDQFGGRLTGSPAYQRAAKWGAEQFQAAGIKNVKLPRPQNGQRSLGHSLPTNGQSVESAKSSRAMSVPPGVKPRTSAFDLTFAMRGRCKGNVALRSFLDLEGSSPMLPHPLLL
jgi:hypothetical protein